MHFYSTYKELKRYWDKAGTAEGGIFTLPIRNWNLVRWKDFNGIGYNFYSTYKELKPRQNLFFHTYRTYFYSTYKELKHGGHGRQEVIVIEFLLYL